MASRQALYVIAVCVIIGCVLAAPLRTRNQPHMSRVERQNNETCSIVGNADFYGLGIRIGIYLQWITTFLTHLLLHEAVDSNLTTNTIFLLALFVATAVSTFQNGIQTVEALVLLQLSFGFVFSILTIGGSRARLHAGETKSVRLPMLAAFIRLTLVTALSAYGLWFWFYGVVRLHMHRECTNYMFMFAKVDVAGGVKVFLKLQSTIVLVAYGFMFALYALLYMFLLAVAVAWAFVLALVLAVFGAVGLGLIVKERQNKQKNNDNSSRRSLLFGTTKTPSLIGGFLKQWFALSCVIVWKYANNKSLPVEPNAESSMGDFTATMVFLSFSMFFFRSAFQAFCLLVFKHCPPSWAMPILTAPKRKMTKAVAKRLDDILASTWRWKLVWLANGMSIAWSIISVELLLVWNNVDGVFTISSTGQLIPFITGIISSITFLHQLSVQQSRLRFTDMLMGLLDVESPDGGSNLQNMEIGSHKPGKSAWREEGPCVTEEQFSLHDGHELVFWIRKHHKTTRSRSIGVVNNNDRANDQVHVPWECDHVILPKDWRLRTPWHLHYFDRPEVLKEQFHSENLIAYSLIRGKEVCFVRNYKALDKVQQSNARSRPCSPPALPNHISRPDDQSGLSVPKDQLGIAVETSSHDPIENGQPSTTTIPVKIEYSRSRSWSRGRSIQRARSLERESSRSSSSGGGWNCWGRKPRSRSRSRSRGSGRGRSRSSTSGRTTRSTPRSVSFALRVIIGTTYLLRLVGFGRIYHWFGQHFRSRCQVVWNGMKHRIRHDFLRDEQFFVSVVEPPQLSIPPLHVPGPRLPLSSHVRNKDILTKDIFNRRVAKTMAPAFMSFSLPLLIPALAKIAVPLCHRGHLPRTLKLVEEIVSFIEDSRSIRQNRRKQLTVQHEEMLKRWEKFKLDERWKLAWAEIESRYRDNSQGVRHGSLERSFSDIPAGAKGSYQGDVHRLGLGPIS